MANILIIFGAEYLIALPAIVLIVYFFLSPRIRRRWLALISVVSFPLAYAVGKVAGMFYNNPRPFVSDHIVPLVQHVSDNGFPSDHTLFAATMASVMFIFNRRFGIALYVIAIIIGISRVLAGVHHVVDIVGGALIAPVVVYITYRFLGRWFRK